MSDLRLNDEQQRAVTCGPGPKLILAGPGSGKTSVITARVIELISRGTKPENILALTFSNRAAEEMRGRIEEALGPPAALITIGTFHAFCADILRVRAIDAGIDPFFDIATKADSLVIMLKAISRLDFGELKLRPESGAIGDLAAFFSHLKEELIAADEFAAFASAQPGQDGDDKKAVQLRDVAAAYHAYQESLAAAGLLDFGDLIISTIDLFEKRPDVLGAYQNMYDHILVDEFQDTNFAQGYLLRLLAGAKQNLFVVGDDDQSIYRWRGASLKNILDFEKAFPEAESIALRMNYRSTPTIVAAGQGVIVGNRQRRAKDLASASKEEGTVSVVKAADTTEEAEAIGNEIQRLIAVDPEVRPSVAILLKTVKNDAGPYLRALDARGLSYEVAAAGDLFDSEPVRDLVAWLKVLADPFDDTSVARTITGEPFYLPFIDFARLNRRHKDVPAIDLLRRADDLAPPSLAKIKAWLEAFRRLSASRNRDDVSRYVREIIDVLGLRGRIIDDLDLAGRARLAELGHVETIAASFNRFSDRPTLAAFVAYVDWLAAMRLDQSRLESAADVTVLTIHGAKGLEFDHVFMPNLTRSKLPGARRWKQFDIPEPLLKEDLSDVDQKSVHEAEQRRVFYVGATRAKKGLYLSYPLTKQGKDDPSPYLLDICAALAIEPTAAAAAIEPPPSETAEIGETAPALACDPAAYRGLSAEEAALVLADELKFWAGAAVESTSDPRDRSGLAAALTSLIKPEFHDVVLARCRPVAADGAGLSQSYVELVAGMLDQNGGLNLTVSDLKTYQQCPRQFRYRSIDKIRTEPDATRELGTRIHQVLQVWHQNNKRPQADLAQLQDLFTEAMEHIPKARRPGAKQIEKVRLALDAYYEDFLAQPGEPEHFEKPFSVSVGPHTIRGRIDRIDFCAADIELVDYKTGKVMKPNDLKCDLQLPIYHLGAAEIFGRAPTSLVYYFVVEQEKKAVSPSAEDLEAAKATVAEIAGRVIGAEFDPRPDFVACRYCDYALLCPAKEGKQDKRRR